MLFAKIAVEILKGPEPPSVDIRKSLLNRLKRFLALFVSLILDFPIHEDLIDGEIRSPIGEFLFDEAFEGLEIVNAFGSHDWNAPLICPRIPLSQ